MIVSVRNNNGKIISWIKVVLTVFYRLELDLFVSEVYELTLLVQTDFSGILKCFDQIQFELVNFVFLSMLKLDRHPFQVFNKVVVRSNTFLRRFPCNLGIFKLLIINANFDVLKTMDWFEKFLKSFCCWLHWPWPIYLLTNYWIDH